MDFKVLSVESHNSINLIDRLIEVVEFYIRKFFGALGSQEFTIDRFDLDDSAEIWDIKLMRRVNRKTMLYEMSIDNHTGELLSFGRGRR